MRLSRLENARGARILGFAAETLLEIYYAFGYRLLLTLRATLWCEWKRIVSLAKRLGVKNAENFWAGLGALIDKRDRGKSA